MMKVEVVQRVHEKVEKEEEVDHVEEEKVDHVEERGRRWRRRRRLCKGWRRRRKRGRR